MREKFNDFKESHELAKHIYDFPSKDERNSLINTQNNFWKLNNIMNIVANID